MQRKIFAWFFNLLIDKISKQFKQMNAAIKLLQQNIAGNLKQKLKTSVVVWQIDLESPTDWIVLILNISRSEFDIAKQIVRSFREQAEQHNISILPMPKDVETSIKYYAKYLKKAVDDNT
jgi:hypothetical protein